MRGRLWRRVIGSKPDRGEEPGGPAVATEGLIRGGRLQVTLCRPDLAPADVLFRFVGSPAADPVQRRSWPGDFRIVTGESGLLGSIDLGDPWAMAPFERLVVEDAAGEAYPTGERWYVQGLFASDAEQFVARFYRPRDRVCDAEGLTFAARQILRFYEGPESHRIVAAVMFGYKALDIVSAPLCREAIDVLTPMLEPAFALPRNRKPRIDGPHLALSIATILAHLHLALGDGESLCAVLDRAAGLAEALPDPMTTTSFNTSRLLLLRAFLFEARGERTRAQAGYAACYEFFRRSLLRLEPNLTRFRELAETHRTVELALRAAESLRGREPPLTRDEVFAGFNRTRTPEATAFMRAGYDTILP